LKVLRVAGKHPLGLRSGVYYYAQSQMAPPLILKPAVAGGAQDQAELECCTDARTGMPCGIPRGAMCVQRFDDSLNSAIHITYRISLRSSSMPEPRDPLLKVLTIIYSTQTTLIFRV
jgi:hypothetical protein